MIRRNEPTALARRWLVLQHVAWEGPGLIGAEADARHLHPEVLRLDLSASLPLPDKVEGLIVMGGPMGVYEYDKYPFLAAECSFIAEMVRRNRPVLGVCLGAQLLARALGARVFPGDKPEVRFGLVKLTAETDRDPLFGPEGPEIPVFHWHGDTFDLPQGATLLASSADYPYQAFRFGQCAYGLQFHVEPDASTWSAWRNHLPTGSIDVPEQRIDAVACVGRRLIARFFDLVLGAAPSTETLRPGS